MLRRLCSLLVCVILAVPFAFADDAGEGKKVEGTWKPVSAELAGKPFPDEVLKNMKLVISDGKYTVTIGEQSDEGTLKVDPAKKPQAMTITGTKGPNKDKKILAIYELKDNSLRICYDLSGEAHPKEFKTKPDSKLFLVEYKRQKAE
jgi:uncharacterized protein (TIGR03067 family)